MPSGQAKQAKDAAPTDPNVPGGHAHVVVVASGAEMVGPGHEFLRPAMQMKFAGQSLQTVSSLALHGFEMNLPGGHREQAEHVRLSPLVTWSGDSSRNIAKIVFLILVIFAYIFL